MSLWTVSSPPNDLLPLPWLLRRLQHLPQPLGLLDGAPHASAASLLYPDLNTEHTCTQGRVGDTHRGRRKPQTGLGKRL